MYLKNHLLESFKGENLDIVSKPFLELAEVKLEGFQELGSVASSRFTLVVCIKLYGRPFFFGSVLPSSSSLG